MLRVDHARLRTHRLRTSAPLRLQLLLAREPPKTYIALIRKNLGKNLFYSL